MVKTINISITVVIGCGKCCWGFCLCSKEVCSDAQRLFESLCLCLHREGEDRDNKRGLVWYGGDECLMLVRSGSLPPFLRGGIQSALAALGHRTSAKPPLRACRALLVGFCLSGGPFPAKPPIAAVFGWLLALAAQPRHGVGLRERWCLSPVAFEARLGNGVREQGTTRQRQPP